MRTRRQLLEAAALGLTGCLAAGCGHSRVVRGAPNPAAAAPARARLLLTQGAKASAPAVRLTPPPPHVPVKPAPTRLWRPGDLVLAGDRGGPPIVALTSDDGPWPNNTERIMNHMRDAGLERDGGLIEFFMVGNNVAAFDDVGRQVVGRGYPVANHSLTHSTYVPSRIAAEIGPANDVISSTLGVRPSLFRSPGLTQGAVIQERLDQLGMCNVFTDSDLHDWSMPRLSAAAITARLAGSIHPGNIILFHDGGSHQNTVDAIPLMLAVIRERGYQIVRLDKLLATANLRVQAYVNARAQIAADVAARGDGAGADEVTDPVVELRTYLELSAHLTPERRARIERAIAAAEAARAGG